MKHLAVIFLGGGLGAISRYLISKQVNLWSSSTFPWGTLTVNMLGSFIIGLLFGLSEVYLISPQWRLFLMVGFLGALTTFSSFSLETINLLRENQLQSFILNILFNNIGSITMAVVGMIAVKALLRTGA
jgi:CrcB protein